jgi:hypothetical protein
VFRPQEAVAAVAALDQAYRDYFAAVGDQNRAQFQLYRALGHPAQCLATAATPPATLPATTVPVEARSVERGTRNEPSVFRSEPRAPRSAHPQLGAPVPVSVEPAPYAR